MSTDSTNPAPNHDGLDPLEICTLPADGLGERLAWVRAEILPHAIAIDRSEDGIAWKLEDVPGLAEKLDRLVALERECCVGVVFEHRMSSTPGRRVLEVRGIDPRAAVFAKLQPDPVGSARKDPGESARKGGRLAKAAAFGAALSLILCCVFPIAAAALFGAAVATPFASLDDPWIIAGAALLFGAGAYAWQNRRRAAAPEQVSCGDRCQSNG